MMIDWRNVRTLSSSRLHCSVVNSLDIRLFAAARQWRQLRVHDRVVSQAIKRGKYSRSKRLLRQNRRGRFGEIGEDDVGAGAAETGEHFEDDLFFVEPAVLERRP